MKKILIERNIVVFLFVIVLVIFSLAERATQKLEDGYSAGALLQNTTPDLRASIATVSRADKD